MVLTLKKTTDSGNNIATLSLDCFNCHFLISILIENVQKHRTKIGMVDVNLVI